MIQDQPVSELSEQLRSIVRKAEPRLRAFSENETGQPVLSGGWSRKQVLGHLIDSASNNHQRFVRAALQDTLDFPRYDQEGCIRLQAPGEADWALLISLWASYNQYLAHVINRLPASKLQTPCRIGPAEPVTLGFVATDYVRHLLHHLRQIGAVDPE